MDLLKRTVALDFPTSKFKHKLRQMRSLKTVYEANYLTQKTSNFITDKCLNTAHTVCMFRRVCLNFFTFIHATNTHYEKRFQ